MIILNVVLLLIPAYVVYVLLRYCMQRNQDARLAQQNGCQAAPWYPHIDPVLGLDAFFRTLKALRRGHMMDDFHDRFESVSGGVKTYKTTFMGSQVVHTMEPQNTKTVLGTNFKHYNLTPARKSALAPFGHGIFSSDGNAWEESRAMLRPNFARDQIDDLEILEHHVSLLVARIPKNGQIVNLEELFQGLTMDAISFLLFGKSTDILSGNPDPKAAKFCEIFNDVSRSLAKHMRIGPLATIVPNPEFLRGAQYIKDFINVYVSRAMAIKDTISQEKGLDDTEQERYTFLRELAVRGYPFERIQIELLGTLVAGRDTTATVLTSLWYTLARRPDVFHKLRQEVVERIGHRPPTIDDLKNLQYLRWTVNETQRLYPAIPMMSRIAVVDTVLPLGGGKDGKSPVFVKAGTRVYNYVYSLHRAKDRWGQDADEFKPERWDGLKGREWDWIPFSGGPRICIGQKMGLNEVLYTTVRLLQAFTSIAPGDDSVWAENMTISMSVRGGCKVRLTTA